MKEPYVILCVEDELNGNIIYCPTEEVADHILPQVKCMLAVKMKARELR